MRQKITLTAFLLLAACACAERLVGFPTVDDTAPTVLSTSPLGDATAVDANTLIVATFSEPLDPQTVDATTFKVSQGAVPIEGTVTLVGEIAYFAPSARLAADANFTATVSAGVTDLAGNHLAADHSWQFKVAAFDDVTAPVVVAAYPFEGAVDVSADAVLRITFSEAMLGGTLAGAIVLMADDQVVAGTVNGAGSDATFTPTAALLPGQQYMARVGTEATDLAGNALAAAYEWQFTVTAALTDEVAPTITATNPVDAATAVGVNARIIATFSEPMAPGSITGAFSVSAAGVPVAGSVSYVGFNAYFDAADDFDADTVYTATITAAAADLAGNTLAAAYSWQFTTATSGLLPDTSAPTVSATNPADQALGVAVVTPIVATFSEAMAAASFAGAFAVSAAGVPVAGQVAVVGPNATFVPDANLVADTLYTVTIGTAVTDLAGNALAAEYSWQFTTGVAPDSLAPTVVSTDPLADAMGVVLTTRPSAIFSEAMDANTLVGNTFQVFNGLVAVPGTVRFAGLTLTFEPQNTLAPDTEFTATITTAARDLAGNALAADYTWRFTTGPVPDVRRPQVTLTTPARDAEGVPTDSRIVAVFTEALDPASVNATSFVVERLGVPVVGVVSFSGVTAVFTPAALLAPSVLYTAVLTTDLRDLAGNTLAAPYVWTFRTGLIPDTTQPLVLGTLPEDEAIDVSPESDVSITFNEVMDPLSITPLNFTLSTIDGDVEGAVITVGATATFRPTELLLADTEYTATVANTVTDLAGNTLADPYVWTFTTGPLVDLGTPLVLSTNPEDLELDVALDQSVNATFNRPMDALTINAATFTLTGPANIDVEGLVTYDALTLTATLVPLEPLLPATTYVARLTLEVADLAGNPLPADYEWSFTTAEEVRFGLQPVNLRSLITFAVAAGSGLTNSNSAGFTVINGDVALSPTATCLSDGIICGAVSPTINGTLYANDPEGVAAQAMADLTDAYIDAMSRPVGTIVNDITGMTLAPGVYTSDSTMSIAVGGTVTLDGQGDANAVFIFQVGSSLTVNNSAQILLVNGARAKNVFWAVFASSTLGGNVAFQGSVLAGASNSVGTGSTVLGRLLCRIGQITLLANTITRPAP